MDIGRRLLKNNTFFFTGSITVIKQGDNNRIVKRLYKDTSGLIVLRVTPLKTSSVIYGIGGVSKSK